MKWKREKVFISTKLITKLVRPLFTLLETKTVFYTLKDKGFEESRLFKIDGMLVLAATGHTSARILTNIDMKGVFTSYEKDTRSKKWFIKGRLNSFSTYEAMESIV